MRITDDEAARKLIKRKYIFFFKTRCAKCKDWIYKEKVWSWRSDRLPYPNFRSFSGIACEACFPKKDQLYDWLMGKTNGPIKPIPTNELKTTVSPNKAIDQYISYPKFDIDMFKILTQHHHIANLKKDNK